MQKGSFTRQLRLPRFTSLALTLLAALLSAACNPQPGTNTQPATNTPTVAPTQTATATPQGAEALERGRCTTDEEVQNYLNMEVEKATAEHLKKIHPKDDGHDEPIIITDGSLHIGTEVPHLKDPKNLLDIFEKTDEYTYTQKSEGQVERIVVINHPNSSQGAGADCTALPVDTNEPVTITLDYKNKHNFSSPEFLTLTTAPEGKRLVIKSVQDSAHVPEKDVPFSKYVQEAKKWSYEGGNGEHPLGHQGVLVKRANKPNEDFPERHGNSIIVLHYWVTP